MTCRCPRCLEAEYFQHIRYTSGETYYRKCQADAPSLADKLLFLFVVIFCVTLLVNLDNTHVPTSQPTALPEQNDGRGGY